MPGIARLVVTAFDTRDPVALAEFYSALTGWPIERTDEDWVQLQSDGGASLAFQLAPDHEPPVWPSADRPQQAHLDLAVPDLDAATARIEALGGRLLSIDKDPEGEHRVMADTEGNEFTILGPLPQDEAARIGLA